MLLAQFRIQSVQISHHRVIGQTEKQRPAGIGIAQTDRHPQFYFVVFPIHPVDQLIGQLSKGGHFLGIQHLTGRVTQGCALPGPGHQPTTGADQCLVALPLIQAAVALFEHALQEFHRQVRTDNAEKLVIEDDRGGKGGQHHAGVTQLVGGRVDHAGAQGIPRAEVVFPGANAGFQQGFILQLGQQLQCDAAIGIAVPVGDELPALTVPRQAGALVELVQPVKGARFPGHVGSQQLGLIDQYLLDITEHFLTAEHDARQAVLHIGHLPVE